MLAEVIAVVTPEDDDGVFEEALPFHGRDDFADLRVHVADACKVAVAHLRDLLRARRVLGLDTGKKFSANVTYIYKKQLEEAGAKVTVK